MAPLFLSLSRTLLFFPSLLSAQRGTTNRTPLHSAAAAPFLEPTCERRGQKKLRKLNNRIVFFSTRRDIVESLTLYRDTHHLSRNGRHRILCLASSKSHVRFEADFKYRLRVCLLLFPLFIYFFFFFFHGDTVFLIKTRADDEVDRRFGATIAESVASVTRNRAH